MIPQQSLQGSLSLRLIREFFVSDDDQFGALKPISNREFYSVLAMLIAGLALLAVTIGPLKII